MTLEHVIAITELALKRDTSQVAERVSRHAKNAHNGAPSTLWLNSLRAGKSRRTKSELFIHLMGKRALRTKLACTATPH